ncbi:unnamed protein product [Hyaloperonospora brassicae]|uniref:Homeobox domain-containing protein n=1 Tax=Hyaloperonospora brassicae TaxID=162125 RepID=A0AAV0UPB4_HYABA|nr:unnamed protein product [Hyaloperonospora brassicae]
MMTTQQQSADQVKSYAYPLGPPSVDIPHTAASVAPCKSEPTAVLSDARAGATGGSSTDSSSSTTALPDRKRKEPASPSDRFDADGRAEAVDKQQQLQPSKKSRRELPPHTVAILKGWMLSREHVKHPYPTDEDKQVLLKKTGISMKQLTNWFTNARKRIWKPMMRREHSRQMQSAIDFDHTAVREFPGSGLCQQYAQSSYAPRSAVRHSFDVGSLGAPPHMAAAAAFDRCARPQAIPVDAPMYPIRAMRSMSEAPTRTEVDGYVEPERIRERELERGRVGCAPRNSLSPRGHKILQEWVTANAQREYSYPNDAERLQLARDTGLDVLQVDEWVTSLREQMGIRGASIRSAGHALFPLKPAVYGERRSIPTSGNSMFPPRQTISGSLRSSVPSVGNPQFPPPPVRREVCDSQFAAFPSAASNCPGHETSRVRSMTISTSPYLLPPSSSGSAGVDTQGQTAESALPSLASRSLMGRPPPIVTCNGPTMGQPRDSRSRTLDMGQFANARRRKMTFQDILASSSGPAAGAVPAAATSSALPQTTSVVVASIHNMANVYPNNGVPSITAYPGAASSGFQPKHPSSSSSEQQSGRRIV